MDIQPLRTFATVADELHFGRAAERLHMAQQAVSQQIKRLERDLGAQLLRRTTRRVELMQAGAALQAELGKSSNTSTTRADGLAPWRPARPVVVGSRTTPTR